MRSSQTDVPTRTVVLILLFIAGIPTSLYFAFTADGLLQIFFAVIASLYAIWYVLFSLGRDPFEAWSNERFNDSHPEIAKNSDIGETVKVLSKFRVAEGSSEGQVLLNGETWQACSDSGEHFQPGDILEVIDRRGLVLVVAQSNNALHK